MASDVQLSALIDAWIASLWARNRISSARTESAYRSDLALWARSCGAEDGVLRVEHLEVEVLQDALAAIARAGYAVSTRARMLAALRGLCGWLHSNGHLVADPSIGDGLRIPPSRRACPSALSDEELTRLITTVATADPGAQLAMPARDLAIVATLAGCGLRGSELCGLVNRDVLVDPDPLLVVRGKGRKQRRVPIPDPVLGMSN